MRRLLVLVGFLSSGCAPCAYDNGILRGQLTGEDGLGLEDGRVRLVSGTGEEREVSVFSDGQYEASLPAGSWEVVGWDAGDTCFSAISVIELAPCDELVVDLELVDCL